MGCSYSLTSSVEDVNRFTGPIINYSHTEIPGVIQVIPCELLAQAFIKEQSPVVEDDLAWTKIFFRTGGGEIPFDVFAASFYLLSRYEEYLPYSADEHGRFRGNQSFAFAGNFLHLALVDRWCVQLTILLQKNFSSITTTPRIAQSSVIVDIDFMYRYKAHGVVMQLLKLFKSMLTFHWADAWQQVGVWFGRKDPYDTYSFINEIVSPGNSSLKYFVLASNAGGHDKNIDPSSPVFCDTINKLQLHAEIGIHPGYRSNRFKELVAEEISLLARCVRQPVVLSRQHYLKLQLPDTYRQLVLNGITDDYSMQYPDRAGFRASTSIPFLFYDLQNEEVLPLLIHPVCVMEVTLKNYMGLTAAKALEVIRLMWIETERVNGNFISAWHNSTLTNSGEWKGWRNIFISTINRQF